MKKITLLLTFIGMLSFGKTFSQACPDIATVIPLPTEEVIFAFNATGPDCGDRPAAIVIDGSAYVLGNCDEFSSRYVLTSGSGVIDPLNFSVTYGGSTCSYVNNVLGLKELFLFNKKTLELYPNPIKQNSLLTIRFALPMSADVKIYDLSGKLMIKEAFKNTNQLSFNIRNLSSGLYLIKLETETASLTRKLVVKN